MNIEETASLKNASDEVQVLQKQAENQEFSSEKLKNTVIVDSKETFESDDNGQELNFFEYTAEEEKTVLRKIDRFVLPVMCFVFFSQYLDKQVLAYTVVFGLETDLNLDGNQYSWLSSAFYLAQLASQFANGYLLSKFPVKYVTACSIIIWSAICMCLAAPNDFKGFVTVRAFLGFFEGAVSPSFVIITSVYYKKKEHALRTATWVSCNAITQIIGTFLVYGIGKNSHIKLAVWKVTFIICGCITLFFGILFFIAIPFNPGNAWFLNEKERKIAVERILAESDRGEKKSFDMNQLKECLNFDWLTISSFLFGFLVTVTSGPISFSSLIIESFGYDSFKTLAYGSPSGAVQLCFIWIGVLMTTLFPKHRTIIVQILIIVPIIGNILLLALPESDSWGVIVGSWLGCCITSFMCILLSLNASNVRGNTKKSLVNNSFFAGYCLAAIVYPQWWNYTKDPRYRTGLITNLVFWGILEALMVFYRWKVFHENKKRDELEAKGLIPDYTGCTDLTDKQDLCHRYSC
ncbi:hypothetical protein PACTADRAFT_75439 [Pachysolen tannophilus NRRL Y-2460]|uniref:Major facilitator superfamily (MFS) profile domain-containing protein n=1 Tax=Pachysolen tannophilus NRRL Y-2460 TaxID=669874 RepID=A0A1E4TWZ9_PACTA|nr:hypothetical protein PACTADRAFT_75439 [Pachysolen tannophilus NRRL Y-2460]